MRKKLAVLAVVLAGFVLAVVGIARAVDPSQYAYPVAGAPIASISVSTTSASNATALPGGTCYRVACSTTVYWRVGVLPLTALTTDNPLYGPAVELICLRSSYNAIAFITVSGTGTCVLNTYNPAP